MIGVHDILRALGITRNYRGYRRVVFAIDLVLKNEDSLNAVTKEIYQKVADRFGCDWTAVERTLRTIIHRAWDTNKEYLITIAGYPLSSYPTVSEFIAIIYNYMQRTQEK